MIKRIGRTLAVTAAVLAGAVGLPSAARAQAKFELTPFVGSLYPLAKMCTDCNANSDGTNYVGRQVNSATVGGRLSYWLSRTIGIEGSFGYAPSRIEERQDSAGFGSAFSATGHIIQAGGRLLFQPPRTNLRFLVGAGMVSRGGNVWKALKDNAGAKLTSMAGVLGIGVRASVTPKFALNVTAEGDFYSFDPHFGVGATSSNGSKLQTDLLVSVGVPIALSH